MSSYRFVELDQTFASINEGKPFVQTVWMSHSDFYDTDWKGDQRYRSQNMPQWAWGTKVTVGVFVPRGQAVLAMSDGSWRLCSVAIEEED